VETYADNETSSLSSPGLPRNRGKAEIYQKNGKNSEIKQNNKIKSKKYMEVQHVVKVNNTALVASVF